MPYLHCPSCDKTLYSAVPHPAIDRCAHCDAPLEPAARLAEVRALQRTFAARDLLTPHESATKKRRRRSLDDSRGFLDDRTKPRSTDPNLT